MRTDTLRALILIIEAVSELGDVLDIGHEWTAGQVRRLVAEATRHTMTATETGRGNDMASMHLRQFSNCQREHKGGSRKATHEVFTDGGKVVEVVCRAHATSALEDAQAAEDAKDRPNLPEAKSGEAPKE